MELSEPATQKQYFLVSALMLSLCSLAYVKLWLEAWSDTTMLGVTVLCTCLGAFCVASGLQLWRNHRTTRL